MANGNTNFFGNTPDYGLSQKIIDLLELTPEGGMTGTRSTSVSDHERIYGPEFGTIAKGMIAINPFAYITEEGREMRNRIWNPTEDYTTGQFNPFNEDMIATALARKYGLSEEEKTNLFKPGMFQALSRSMVNMLDPSIHRTELSATQTAAPSGLFSQASNMSPTMAGSGMARKRAMEARDALRRKRAGEIAEMSSNITGQKDSLLKQITAWDTAARDAAEGAGAGQWADED